MAKIDTTRTTILVDIALAAGIASAGLFALACALQEPGTAIALAVFFMINTVHVGIGLGKLAVARNVFASRIYDRQVRP
jgi:hypothetical protein